MTQERYVTSAAIQSIRTELAEDVIPKIKELRGLVDSTELSFPGWGAVGEVSVGILYRGWQEQVREKFGEALEVLDSWQDALAAATTNWRAAEDNSTVVYR